MFNNISLFMWRLLFELFNILLNVKLKILHRRRCSASARISFTYIIIASCLEASRSWCIMTKCTVTWKLLYAARIVQRGGRRLLRVIIARHHYPCKISVRRNYSLFIYSVLHINLSIVRWKYRLSLTASHTRLTTWDGKINVIKQNYSTWPITT